VLRIKHHHVIIINERHLRRVLSSYFRYYHEARTHLSLNKDCPETRPILPPAAGKIVAVAQLGGVHHRIDPDDARGPTIHGLRGTRILARHAHGYDAIGMSSQMIERYMRFKDQMEIAERGRARFRLADRKR
jgi:hypothetical protein